jgi:putative ABC transport system substrate-binding protein
MRRREFITLVGGAAATWSLPAPAQQSSKLPTIGFLGTDPALWNPWVAAFVKRLSELGWSDGHTVEIAYRWDESRAERDAEIASEFVRRKVDIILTNGIAVAALKRATQIIPIVFVLSPDPVGGGLVDNLARPGGNVTGLSSQATDLAAKRVELLREIVPHLQRLAIVADAAFLQAMLEMRQVQATAARLGIEVTPIEIQRAAEIAPAFSALHGRADALYVVTDALTGANRTRIITLALGAHLPAIFGTRDFAQLGGLISYGPSFEAMFRRAAEFIDKILRGAKPSEIPVEQPTKFELAVNLTTAQAIDLIVPPAVLARADEVIE